MPWTTKTMPSQAGKTCIVTGANSGIGFETAKVLALKGADVVLACRSLDRGGQAAREIERQLAGGAPLGPARTGCCCRRAADDLAIIPGGSVTVMPLDLADLASVRAFAAAFLERFSSLDILINNAGVMAPPPGKTADGFEVQMGVNHLGHFALTGLLLPRLLEAARPRLVAVSSVAHRLGCLDLDDLNWQRRRYCRWRAYGDSKLANLYFVSELYRRYGQHGAGLRPVAAHPGWTATNLQKHVWLGRALNALLAMKPWQGALPSLYAATRVDLLGGEYIGPDGCLELRGFPTVVRANKRAHDTALAARLWTLSEELTGVRF